VTGIAGGGEGMDWEGLAGRLHGADTAELAAAVGFVPRQIDVREVAGMRGPSRAADYG
jgi:hypothetical protein